MAQYQLMILFLFILCSNAENSRVTIFSSTLTTLYYTLSPIETSEECLANATDFVYQNSLCGASSPENYNSYKKRYSCSQRCGDQPKHGQEECACDVNCVVYGDCCRDMSIVCPDTYAKGKAKFSHFKDDIAYCPSHSSASDIPALWSCPALHSADEQTGTPSFVSAYDGNVDLPLAPRTIKQYSQNFFYFKVADISTGLVYGAADSFRFCSADNAIPYFIPIETLLDCSNIPATQPRTKSAFQILKWCKKRRIKDSATPFHRNCKQLRVLQCTCSEGKQFRDFVRNACIGYRKDAPLLSRHPIWSTDPIGSRQHYSDKRCTVGKVNDPEKLFKKHNSHLKQGKLLIEMGVYPVPLNVNPLLMSKRRSIHTFATDSNFRSAGLSEDIGAISTTTGHETNEANERVNHLPVEADMMFVVEINGTDERRFLCDSLQQYLSECQLLDCAPGNILWHDPQRYGQVGGSKCLTLSQVVIRSKQLGKPIPLCFCTHILKMLSNFGTWNIIMRVGDEGACNYELLLKIKEEEPIEVHALAKNLRFPLPKTTKTTNASSFIGQVFKQIVPNQCLGFGMGQFNYIEACFQFSNDLFDDPLCLRLSGGKSMEPLPYFNHCNKLVSLGTLFCLTLVITTGKSTSMYM